MIHLATTTNPAVVQQIIHSNPGAYTIPGQNGQIHIYTNGPIAKPAPKQNQKIKQPTQPKYDTSIPWWLMALAALVMLYAVLNK